MNEPDPIIPITRSEARAMRDEALDILTRLHYRLLETYLGQKPEGDVSLGSITLTTASTGSDDEDHCTEFHDMHGGCVAYCDPPGTCGPCSSGGGVAIAPQYLPE